MIIKKILTSLLRNTTIVFTLNMESWFMLIGRCHGNDEWRMDFFRRLIQRLSWIMVSSFAQLKARNEKERKTAKCWQLWLYKPWNRCSPPNKRTYFPTKSICLTSLCVHLHTFVLTSSKSCWNFFLPPSATVWPKELSISIRPDGFFDPIWNLQYVLDWKLSNWCFYTLNSSVTKKTSWNWCRIKTIRKSPKFMPLQFDDCISAGTAEPF